MCRSSDSVLFRRSQTWRRNRYLRRFQRKGNIVDLLREVCPPEKDILLLIDGGELQARVWTAMSRFTATHMATPDAWKPVRSKIRRELERVAALLEAVPKINKEASTLVCIDNGRCSVHRAKVASARRSDTYRRMRKGAAALRKSARKFRAQSFTRKAWRAMTVRTSLFRYHRS